MEQKESKYSKQELKQFGRILGCGFPIVFGLLVPLICSFGIPYWPYYTGGFFLILAHFKPITLKPFYCLWMAIGKVLGTINFFIIMSLIFVFIFTPIGLFFRLIKRDSMNRTWDKDADSYRTYCNDSANSNMEKPY